MSPWDYYDTGPDGPWPCWRALAAVAVIAGLAWGVVRWRFGA